MDENNRRDFIGLIIARCECGECTTFYAKSPVKEFKCHRCDKTSTLTGEPRNVRTRCECGQNIYAVTNSTAELFEFSHSCGYPVTVQYNRKKKMYTSIY